MAGHWRKQSDDCVVMCRLHRENVLNREDAKTAKDTTDRDIEEAAAAKVDNAIEVHRTRDPGLLETVHQTRLGFELGRAGLEVSNRQLGFRRNRSRELMKATPDVSSMRVPLRASRLRVSTHPPPKSAHMGS